MGGWILFRQEHLVLIRMDSLVDSSPSPSDQKFDFSMPWGGRD